MRDTIFNDVLKNTYLIEESYNFFKSKSGNVYSEIEIEGNNLKIESLMVCFKDKWIDSDDTFTQEQENKLIEHLDFLVADRTSEESEYKLQSHFEDEHRKKLSWDLSIQGLN